MALAALTAAPKPVSLTPNNQGYFALNPYVAPTSSAPSNPYTAVLTNQPGAGQNNTVPTGAAPSFGPLTGGTFKLPNGSTVDYGTLLSNDPLLQQTLSQLKAQAASDQAGLNAGEQQALIGYGNVPANVANIPGLSGVLDQTTKDLASQNTAAGLSTYAKLQTAYKNAVQASDSNLAARGMLRSGAFGQENANDLLGYNQAQDTAVQQLNQYLSGIYNGYLTQQQQLQQSEYGAYNDALMRLIQEIQAGLIGGSAPPSGPGSSGAPSTSGSYSSAYGGPYYQNPGANVTVTSTTPIARPGHPVYA